MYQNQRQTDGQTGKVVGSAVSLGSSTQHDKHEHTGEDYLSQQTAQHAHVSLQVVGTRTLETWHILCQNIKKQRTDESTDHLEEHVHATILRAHAATQEAAQRDGGIDMAARDAADCIGHGHHSQSEGEGRTHHSGNIIYRVTTQAHGHAAAHQHEYHGTHHLC